MSNTTTFLLQDNADSVVTTVAAVFGNACSNTICYSIYGIVFPILGLVGLAGNAISAIILSSKLYKSSINTCLLVLTMFDSILVTSCLFTYLPLAHCQTVTSGCKLAIYGILVFYPISVIAHMASVWTRLVISMERFLVVKRPFQARIYCTNRKVSTLLAIFCVFVAICAIPTAFELRYIDSCHCIQQTELRLSHTYIMAYKVVIQFVFEFFIPVMYIAGLNVALISTLREQRKFERTVSQRSGQASLTDRCQRNISEATIISSAIITTFIIPSFLPLVSNLVEAFGSDELLQSTGMLAMTYLGNMLVMLGSDVDFIVYYAAGRRFRQSVDQIICHLSRGQESSIPNLRKLNTSTVTYHQGYLSQYRLAIGMHAKLQHRRSSA